MANLTVDSVAAGKVAELKQGTSLTVEVDEGRDRHRHSHRTLARRHRKAPPPVTVSPAR